MLSEEHQQMMLAYLNGLEPSLKLHSLADLANLSTRKLLFLARKVDDEVLGLFVQLLKNSGQGVTVFEKLMGDHEEENRPLVNAFFSRYMQGVLACSEDTTDYNPLEVYLPPDTFADLAFVQSRQSFFLRQRIDVINAYLLGVFPESPTFIPGEENQAWMFFWGKVMQR